MARTESAFETWFVQKHGPRPGGGYSDQDLLDQKASGDAATKTLMLRGIWDAQFNAALYAWNARNKRTRISE